VLADYRDRRLHQPGGDPVVEFPEPGVAVLLALVPVGELAAQVQPEGEVALLDGPAAPCQASR
jgi:hypothetical protein